ncbi:MAG: amidohydrolase family protein [Treponema sp.]|jgi:predicted TIM-barrel fold metal-dependent hydrolase|nr:amidohydrolase family protein [Treponema sp.]
MTTKPIWDAHVHLFPEEIYRNWDKYAARDTWFGILTKKPEDGKGTEEAWANIDEALAAADKAGVWGLAMQGWYWNDEGLMIMHNDYMADAFHRHPDRLVGFASINPKFGGKALAEIERCASLGFAGIGELGPGGNGYDFNDPDFLAAMECAQHYKLPVCIHCGEPVGHPYPGRDMTSLAPLPGVAKRFPQLTLILAHMGGGLPFYAMNPRLQKSLGNVYYDTAANPLLYSIRSIKAVIAMVGVERLLFGSDFPLLLYPSRSREMDFSLFLTDIRDHAGLSAAESDRFFSDNFRTLFHLQ